VKQGVDEVVVEMEQLWLRPIDETNYIDDEQLRWSGVVARRPLSCASARQSGKHRVSEGVGVKQRVRGAFVPIMA